MVTHHLRGDSCHTEWIFCDVWWGHSLRWYYVNIELNPLPRSSLSISEDREEQNAPPLLIQWGSTAESKSSESPCSIYLVFLSRTFWSKSCNDSSFLINTFYLPTPWQGLGSGVTHTVLSGLETQSCKWKVTAIERRMLRDGLAEGALRRPAGVSGLTGAWLDRVHQTSVAQ